MKKRFLIGLLLLLLLSTYSSKNSIDNQYKLNIKEIIIENNNILKKKEVKEELKRELSPFFIAGFFALLGLVGGMFLVGKFRR